MASPDTNGPLYRGSSYNQLHSFVKGERVEPVEPEYFMVAVLQHDKKLNDNEPFKWFKVKPVSFNFSS